MQSHRDKSSGRKKSTDTRAGGSSKKQELTPMDTPTAEVQARQERFKNLNKQSANEFGLVSRGEEKKLQTDPKARHEYFNTIQREFIKHCSDLSGKEALRDELASVKDENAINTKKDIDWVLMSLRKLREALLALKPDEFSKKVFLYSARISTKIGRYETYLPSINFLLNNCAELLSPSEFEETATYLILHTSHFNNDNIKAFRLLYEKLPKARKLKEILVSWYNQDYLCWKALRGSLQYNLGYYKLMRFGEHKILARYLKDIGKSYFQFPRLALEDLSGHSWNSLKQNYDINWVLNPDDDKITIRDRVKKKSVN